MHFLINHLNQRNTHFYVTLNVTNVVNRQKVQLKTSQTTVARVDPVDQSSIRKGWKLFIRAFYRDIITSL